LASSSIVSGTTIYTVASHRTADQARRYRKRILNQQRLAFRGTVLLLIFILVVTFMFTLFFQFDQTVSH
jgi:heme/copper-type cytochrome/quinol oxidase subunit 2